jgi:apolipoprotein N-acyltransferase
MKFSKIFPTFALVFLSGIITGIAPAPLNLWVFAWFSLVPLWIVLRINLLTNSHIKISLILGLAWGVGYNSVALSWMLGIHPMTWLGLTWGQSLAIALFCWLFISFWGAGVAGIWAVLFSYITNYLTIKSVQSIKNLTINPIILPLINVIIGVTIWCSLENLWSFTDLWWTSLSYTQSPGNLLILHLGQISGPDTVTAVIVAVNGLIAESFISYRKSLLLTQDDQNIGIDKKSLPITLLIITVILLAIAHSTGFILYKVPLNSDVSKALKIGIIQGNIPNAIKLNKLGWERAIAGYSQGYENLVKQGVDAVLTPETALPFLWNEINLPNIAFYQTIIKTGVPVWVGGFTQVNTPENQGLANSLLMINNQGEIISQYDKTKLVPLGEYIPFQSLLGKVIKKLSPLDSQLIHGRPDQMMNTPFGLVSAGICYDSAFSQIFQRQTRLGGQFIITAANNAHYSDTMPAQHHAQDLMRAIENDRWLVRATNTGYSTVVNPHGQTIWLSDLHTYVTHSGTIYPRQTKTLYVRWGNWLTPLLIVISGVILLVIRQIFIGHPHR